MKRVYFLILCCFFLLDVSAQSKIHLITEHGNIHMKNGKEVKQISSSASDTLPVMLNGIVFYACNRIYSNGVLMRYNPSTGTTDEMDRIADTPVHFPRGRIVQVLADEKSGRVYYSLKIRAEKGVPIYFTMVYDLKQNKITSYQDGLIEGIDGEGRQTFVYYDLDFNGAYRTKNILNAEGELIQSFEKDYPDPSTFK